MEFQISLTPRAKRDLNDIGRHISQSDSDTARSFCDELLSVAESLQSFPERHGFFRKRSGIKKLPYRNYLIFYKIHEDTHIVEILRFWHSARDQGQLRLKEQPLEAYSVSPNAVPAVR